MIRDIIESAGDTLDKTPGFTRKLFKVALDFDMDGQFQGVRKIEKEILKCPVMSFSELRRSNGSHFLFESAQTICLMEHEEKHVPKHAYFLGLLRQAASIFPALETVADVLESEKDQITEQLREAGVKATDNLMLTLDGQALVDLPEVHAWWVNYRGTQLVSAQSNRLMRDMVTGELVNPVKTHPKIQGLASVGGQASGCALISFNAASFESYGMEQSENAAMSEETAAAYSAALNDLILKGFRFSNFICTAWYSPGVPEMHQCILGNVENMSYMGEDPKGLFEYNAEKFFQDSLFRGKESPYLDTDMCHILDVGANAGRVVIRRYLHTPATEFAKTLQCWFNDLRLDGLETPFRSIKAYLFALKTNKDEDLPAILEDDLWKAATQGTGLNTLAYTRLLQGCLSRIYSGERLHGPTMQLIKLYLNRRGTKMSSGLNVDHTSKAYHCGRLLALVTDLQYAALGTVGADITSKYVKAAMTQPSRVFGNILSMATHYITKTKNPGTWSGRVKEIVGKIEGDFPGTLTRDEQGIFMLGYFQQKGVAFAKKDSGVVTIVESEE